MDFTATSFIVGLLGTLATTISTIVALRIFRRDAANARAIAAENLRATQEKLQTAKQNIVILESQLTATRENLAQTRADLTYYRNQATDLQNQLNNWRHEHE